MNLKEANRRLEAMNALDAHRKAEKMIDALRTERNTLNAEGRLDEADAIAIYIATCTDESAARLYDIITAARA
jgi:hypothetical protein